MSEPQPAASDPRPPFQFSLRTLLLLFVVLGSSLAVFGTWGIVVFAFLGGLAVYLRQAKSFRSSGWLILLALPCAFALLDLLSMYWSAVSTARESARRAQCSNNMKEIALALQAYHQANGSFPPPYTTDKTGKPMHSWRVLILPYLDMGPLYKTYDFTEPWDGPKNKRLLAKCPRTYLCPSDPPASISVATPTSYLAVVGPKAAWANEKPRRLADVSGETRNTILLVEVANSHVLWTEPRDLSPDALGVTDAKSSPLVVSSNHGQREDFFFKYDRASGVNVAMVDGSVRYLWLGNRSIDDLRKLLQIGGFREEESGDPVRRPNWPNIAALAVWLLSVGTLLTLAVRSRKPRSVSPAPQPAN